LVGVGFKQLFAIGGQSEFPEWSRGTPDHDDCPARDIDAPCLFRNMRLKAITVYILVVQVQDVDAILLNSDFAVEMRAICS
jgi:hypothetical protein